MLIAKIKIKSHLLEFTRKFSSIGLHKTVINICPLTPIKEDYRRGLINFGNALTHTLKKVSFKAIRIKKEGPKERVGYPVCETDAKDESRRAVTAELALKQGIEAMDTPPNEARKIVLKKQFGCWRW